MNKMKHLVALFILISAICGCKNRKNGQLDTVDAGIINDTLVAGEFYFKEDPFGETIELEGQNVITDNFFSFSGTELTLKDSVLILKTTARNNTHIVHLYRAPDLKFMGRLGSVGRGPFEFQYPMLVKSADSTALAYLYERNTQKLFKISNTYQLRELPISLGQIIQIGFFGIQSIFSLSENEFIVEESTDEERFLWNVKKANDDTGEYEKHKLLDISFDRSGNPHWAFMGHLATNVERNRVVYGYSFYRRLIFTDLAGEIKRVIKFDGAEFNPETVGIADGMDNNVFHYVDAIGGDDYLYLRYSGKNPVKSAELKDENNTIIIEVWDWNGYPVKRYKLDHLGWITVDEKNKKIYQLNSRSEEPFFVYDLPE